MPRALPDPRLTLCQPLEDPWRDALDALAPSRGDPRSTDAARLGAAVARLSAAYNHLPGAARPDDPSLLAARLLFSFPRDVPKAAAAVAELVLQGKLAVPADRPLSLLDLGAGLGASTWGVARALAARGASGSIEATLVDADPRALSLAARVARAAPSLGSLRVAIATESGALDRAARRQQRQRHDLVVLGQVLSEADADLAPEARADAHARVLLELLEGVVRADGSLVVVEPALRDRTRHLHAVRARVLAAGARVFAPCLHQAACPMIARDDDWCHEDLDVDLPPWLWPVARAAGLRWQGLTFSYLVLRPDGASLAAGRSLWRVVAAPRRTKGRCDLLLCGDPADGAAARRVGRLDRDRTASNQALDDVGRGELVAVAPTVDRLDREASFERVAP